MSKSNDNLILLGVIGLGAFFLMSRPGMAGGLAPRVDQSQMNAAQWASSIASGLSGLFKGGSSASNGWTKGSDGFWTSPGGNSTNPKSPTFMGPPTSENMPVPNWGSYAGGGSDGVALNPGQFQDPYDYGQYF